MCRKNLDAGSGLRYHTDVYVAYEAYRPSDDSQALLKQIVGITHEYKAQGLRMTLRQLFYQLVQRAFIENTKHTYRNLGALVTSARMGGMLDWDVIEDRARSPETPSEFESLSELMDAAFASYRLPRLKGQQKYVELWVEKDALASVLEPITREYHITLMVNRGYSSTSAIRESGLRLRKRCREIGASEAVVLYLGDLDPSGEDMVRDVAKRLNVFLNGGHIVTYRHGRPLVGGGAEVEEDDARADRLPWIDVDVQKIGITYEQAQAHHAPPNVTKKADPRSKQYIEKYGMECWEVDALPPTTLRDIIDERLANLLDLEAIEAVKFAEELDKTKLRRTMLLMQTAGEGEYVEFPPGVWPVTLDAPSTSSSKTRKPKKKSKPRGKR